MIHQSSKELLLRGGGDGVGVAESFHVVTSREEHCESYFFLKKKFMQTKSVRITAIMIYQCQTRKRNRMLNPEQGGLGQYAEKKDVWTIFIICKLFHKNLFHKFLSLKKWHKIIVKQDWIKNTIFKSNAAFRSTCCRHE